MSIEKETTSIGRIPVHVTQNPGRPLILLVRLASKDMGIWDTIWDNFAQYFTVANFDFQALPGANQRDDPGEGFRQLAQNCVEVASGLGFEKFHLFGWYGGTQVVMRCAVDFPERVQSCILLDPFFELPDMRKVEKAIEFKRILFEHPNRGLYAYYWVMAGLSPQFVEKQFDEVERLVAARLRGDKFIKADVDRFLHWVRAIRRNWITDEEFARITALTLILATELDPWHAGPSVSMAREVHRRIRSSRLEVIKGYGGLFLVEAPDKFMSLVEPFIRSVV